MRLPRFLLTLTLTFYSITSPAVGEQDIEVNPIQVWSSASGGNIIRVMTPGQTMANPANCIDPDSYFVRTTTAKEAQARIFAVLLTARVMGLPVNLRILGCESNRPAILDAWL